MLFSIQLFGMNKTFLTATLALVLVSVLVTIGNIAIQSAQACPGSGGGAPNANPDVPNNLKTQPRSELATSQSA
jgi:hypothetical protein